MVVLVGVFAGLYLVICLIMCNFNRFVGLLVGWTPKKTSSQEKFSKMKKKDRFVCWIMVTPYVRQYLLTNFKVDDPDWPELVNITQDKFLDTLFRTKLVKPSTRYDKRSERNSYKYRRCKIALEISKSDFYHYGWSLSLTDESTLAHVLEIRCRTILLSYLSAAYLIHPNLNVCINLFYKQFGYDECSWPSDSIRRIWNREQKACKISFQNDFYEKINKIVIVQLFRNGTISQSGKEAYENNSI